MSPTRFVWLGGTVLVTLGLAGISGTLAAVSRAAFFRPPYWMSADMRFSPQADMKTPQ